MTDYRELCRELFGTTDEEEIRKAYAKLTEKKKSGRKAKFSYDQIEVMRSELGEGATINELAAKYNTSRQLIGRYLNRPTEYGYNIRLIYMYKQFPCTIIDVDYLNKTVKIQNRTDDVLHRAFGVDENPSWDDYENFLESRCFPRSREDIGNVLALMGLDSYDPMQIIRKTQGRISDDSQWIRVYGRARGREAAR